MSKKDILSQIKNNLEWLDISIKGKTWGDIVKELKNKINGKASPSIAIETLMLINLLLKLEREEKRKKGSGENGK